MTTQEIKTEIQKSLDRVPDSVLQNILELLKQAEKKSESDVMTALNLNKILQEDNQLLQRLAK